MHILLISVLISGVLLEGHSIINDGEICVLSTERETGHNLLKLVLYSCKNFFLSLSCNPNFQLYNYR
jgi:hypothetical protein